MVRDEKVGGATIPEQETFDTFSEPPGEGWHRFTVNELTFKENDSGDLVGRAVVEVVDGEDAGLSVQDFYAYESKGNFGLVKLQQLLFATGVLERGTPKTKAFFTKAENQERFSEELEGQEFFGRIKHTKGEKGTFGNLVEYRTLDEARELGVTKKGSSKATSKGKETPKGKKRGESFGEEEEE